MPSLAHPRGPSLALSPSVVSELRPKLLPRMPSRLGPPRLESEGGLPLAWLSFSLFPAAVKRRHCHFLTRMMYCWRRGGRTGVASNCADARESPSDLFSEAGKSQASRSRTHSNLMSTQKNDESSEYCHGACYVATFKYGAKYVHSTMGLYNLILPIRLQ